MKKQLHVDISLEMHKRLSEILTDRGMLSAVVRRLLQIYIDSVEHGEPVIPNMFKWRGGGDT